MGVTAKEGQSGIMSRKKLRAQVELQAETSKAKSKRERKRKQLNAIKIKQPKVRIFNTQVDSLFSESVRVSLYNFQFLFQQKMNKPKVDHSDDNFSKLVNKYKTQLASSEIERKKWYEQ